MNTPRLLAAASVLCKESSTYGGPCDPCISEARAVLAAADMAAAVTGEAEQPALFTAKTWSVVTHAALCDSDGVAVSDEIIIMEDPFNAVRGGAYRVYREGNSERLARLDSHDAAVEFATQLLGGTA